jgi:hypothetical protein
VPRGTQALQPRLNWRLPGCHRLWPVFPGPFDFVAALSLKASNPGLLASRFGLLPFRSPLLGKSFLFLRVLRCFSSPGSRPKPMCSALDARAFPRAGFPIRISPARAGAHPSPELFAVCHVLRRRLAPRHPPCALSSLSATCVAEKLSFSRFFCLRCVCDC